MRTLALTTGGWNLVHQMMLIALVLHAQENLGLSAEVYGPVLAGLIVETAEGPLPRDVALTLPFWAAVLGAAALTAMAWRGLAQGFAAGAVGAGSDKKFE